MVNKNTLGGKKWRGQEKQQLLKGLISECGQGLYNSNASLDEILSSISIGGGSRGDRGPWPHLKFKPLHRNSIFAIENYLNLAKWPP